MKKLEQHTPDFTDEPIANIAEMFPHCAVEAEDENGKLIIAIDFDLLKQELSKNIVDGSKERSRRAGRNIKEGNAAKTNAEQIFAQPAPGTEVRVI